MKWVRLLSAVKPCFNFSIASKILLARLFYRSNSTRFPLLQTGNKAGIDLRQRLAHGIDRFTHVMLSRHEDENIALHSAAGARNAIHIASALIFREAVGIELPFVTSDAEQEKTADRYGLKTVFIG